MTEAFKNLKIEKINKKFPIPEKSSEENINRIVSI